MLDNENWDESADEIMETRLILVMEMRMRVTRNLC